MAIRNGRFCCALLALTLAGWTGPSVADDDVAQEPARLEIKHIDDQGRVKIEVGPAPANRLKLVPFPEDLEQDAQTQPTGAVEAEPAAADPSDSPAHKSPAQKVPVPSPDFRRTAQTGDATPRRTTRAPRTLPAEPQGHAQSGGMQRLPATDGGDESEFKPRFRKPTVRQAQHFAPVQSSDSIASDAQPAATAPATISDAAESATTAAEPVAADTTGSAAPPTAAGKALIEQAFAKSKEASTDSDYSEIIELCRRAREEGLKTSHKQYAGQLTSWAYNRRGEARVAEGRDAEAMADFEAAVQLNPNSWRAMHNRGVSFAAQNRIPEAMADFDRVITLNPQYANAYFNRGEMWYMQGRYEQAIGDYTAAIEIGPADAAMYNSRGHASYRIKKFGDALREYGKALELEPKYAAALVNRGDTYLDLSRYGDAATDYRAAIAADPNLARAFQAAAWLMATCPDEHYRDQKLAIEAANKAIELNGDDHRNLETLAAAQANAGMFAEAKATQEKAIAKVPREELVAAEKRMAMYQRELAFREVSRQGMIVANQERLEAGADKKSYPVTRASADLPEGTQGVTYPEAQGYYPEAQGYVPAPTEKRSFWPPQLNPFGRSQRRTGQPAGQRPQQYSQSGPQQYPQGEAQEYQEGTEQPYPQGEPQAYQQEGTQPYPQGYPQQGPRTLPKKPARPPERQIRPW